MHQKQDLKQCSSVEIMKQYMDSLSDEISWIQEITSFQFWKSIATQFLSHFLLIIFGCGQTTNYSSVPPFKCLVLCVNNSYILDDCDNTNKIVSEIKVSLAFGLTAATLVQAMGQNNGCHLTPAITFSLYVTRRISLLRFAITTLTHCLSSIAACAVLYGLLDTNQRQLSGVGLTVPSNTLHAQQVFGYEFLATFIVVLAYLSNIDQPLNALSIGCAFTIAHLFSFQHTGASMSPARTLGPAVIKHDWRYHWIYWLAPMIAGMISGLTHQYIKSSPNQWNEQSLLSRQCVNHLSNNDCETEITLTSYDYPK